MSGLCFFADYLLATVKRETTVAYMSGHVGSRELQRAFGEVLNGRAERPCERVLAAHFWTSRSPDGEFARDRSNDSQGIRLHGELQPTAECGTSQRRHEVGLCEGRHDELARCCCQTGLA